MRKVLPVISVIAAISIFGFKAIEPLPIGSSMSKATVKLKDISGSETSIKDVAKKNGVLVMFSCNTCPYVMKNQQRTNEVCAYAEKTDIGVIILNSNEGARGDGDSYAEIRTYAKENQYTWKYAVDESHQVADAFGAKRTPECFLFNSELKLVYHGAIDDNPGDARSVTRKHLQVAIDELASGKEVSVKESRSVGCGIKRKNA